jgi:hypothetical protein
MELIIKAINKRSKGCRSSLTNPLPETHTLVPPCGLNAKRIYQRRLEVVG